MRGDIWDISIDLRHIKESKEPFIKGKAIGVEADGEIFVSIESLKELLNQYEKAIENVE